MKATRSSETYEEKVERRSWHLAEMTQSQERMDAVRASYSYKFWGGFCLSSSCRLRVHGQMIPPLADARFFVQHTFTFFHASRGSGCCLRAHTDKQCLLILGNLHWHRKQFCTWWERLPFCNEWEVIPSAISAFLQHTAQSKSPWLSGSSRDWNIKNQEVDGSPRWAWVWECASLKAPWPPRRLLVLSKPSKSCMYTPLPFSHQYL